MLPVVEADYIFQYIEYFVQIFIFQEFDRIAFGCRNVCHIIHRDIVTPFQGSEYFSGSGIGKS